MLIISDLKMPSISGMEVIKMIKEVNSNVRTILMTAFANDDLIQEYTKKGLINGFLQKPIHLTDLYTAVTTQIHTYEFQKQKSLIRVNEIVRLT